MTKGNRSPVHHYLLLDRHSLNAYVVRREQTLLLFALAQSQDTDPHSLYVDDLLMSPGTENYKTPPDEDLAEEVHRFFDVQLHRKYRNLSRQRQVIRFSWTLDKVVPGNRWTAPMAVPMSLSITRERPRRFLSLLSPRQGKPPEIAGMDQINARRAEKNVKSIGVAKQDP